MTQRRRDAEDRESRSEGAMRIIDLRVLVPRVEAQRVDLRVLVASPSLPRRRGASAAASRFPPRTGSRCAGECASGSETETDLEKTPRSSARWFETASNGARASVGTTRLRHPRVPPNSPKRRLKRAKQKKRNSLTHTFEAARPPALVWVR